AVGCIFGELINNSPLFPGENDIEQLCCVLRVLGTPNQQVWPGCLALPDVIGSPRARCLWSGAMGGSSGGSPESALGVPPFPACDCTMLPRQFTVSPALAVPSCSRTEPEPFES
ncbi:hypothetical protein Z043_106543, partial [Scleropages formosus]